MKYFLCIVCLCAGLAVGFFTSSVVGTSPDKSWERVVQFKKDSQDPSKYRLEGNIGSIGVPETHDSDLANLVAHGRLIRTQIIFADIPRSKENVTWIMTMLNHPEILEATSPNHDNPFSVEVHHTPKHSFSLGELVKKFKEFSKTSGIE